VGEPRTMLGFRIEQTKITQLDEIARARSVRMFGREGEIDKGALCRQAVIEFINRERAIEPTLADMPD